MELRLVLLLVSSYLCFVHGNDQCTLTFEAPDPKSGCCGVDQSEASRVLGPQIDQNPWMVLIGYKTKENKTKLVCGGVLISGLYVLTAAHCTKIFGKDHVRRPIVYLGEYDITNDPTEPDCIPAAGGGEDCNDGVTVIPVDAVIPNEDFFRGRRYNNRDDIALLKLSRIAPYTDFIRPICLPESDIAASNSPDLRLHVSGWNMFYGNGTTKQNGVVVYRNETECKAIYSDEHKINLWEKQICAGGERNVDSCIGDSASPLMYQRGRVFEATGIFLFSPRNCSVTDTPAVYTNVYKYIDWIKKNMRP